MNIKQLEERTGGLSRPSKMPCYGYSLPASKCHTGSKLRGVENSVCSFCYSCKGRFLFSAVQAAMHRRWEVVVQQDRDNVPIDQGWSEWMVELIGRQEKSGYFRHHDSGDIQSPNHLRRIIYIAQRLPDIRFWLPTREYGMVSDVRRDGPFPENLTIRLSASMVGGPVYRRLAKRLGVSTSAVVTNGATCPAPRQGGVCGDCRACWDSKRHVTYTLH